MGSESKTSLGEFLRQERERRGVTIEQVASATKIGIRVLHALEADHYADLPAKPFIRGFVNSYVRFIGLDPQEVLTRYGDFIDSRSQERPNREGGHSGYVFEKREGEQNRTILWVIMTVFVVFGGVTVFLVKPKLKHHRQSHVERLREVHVVAAPSPSPTPVPSEILPQPVPSPSSVPSPEPSVAPSPKFLRPDPLNSGLDLERSEIKYKVIFKALADVWVRYQTDDKPLMKFILRKDKILVLRAKEQIRFQASNPKAITFDYNGRGAKLVEAEKHLAQHQKTATLLFPFEVAEKIEEPFPGEAPLPSVFTPNLRPAPTPSTATP
jgi:cytoskeleton protein RodZ